MSQRQPLLLILLLAAACGGEPARARVRPPGADGSLGRGREALADAPPDVLLVTIDTLRADFTSPYGHPADPTPALRQLAAAGARFARHYSVMSHTVPAHTSLFTGLRPRVHGTRKNGHRVRGDVALLAEAFRDAGYRTSAVVAVTFLGTRTGFDRGFESFNEDFTNSTGFANNARDFQRDATDVVDHAVAELGAGDGRPRFLWVHMYDPHYPHDAPAEFALTEDEARARYAARAARSRLFQPAQLVERLAGYEAEVRYADRELGRLLAAWDTHARGRQGLVVVTADHGEGLGEHELLGHGLWNYEEQLLVPLVLRMRAAVPAGAVVEGCTSQVDVAATIAELAGVPSALGGQSLVPLLRGEEAPGERAVLAERRLFTEPDWAAREDLRELLAALSGLPGVGRGEQIALVQGDYKYIWSEGAPDELFRLDRDPHETRVIVDAEPQRAREMLRVIEAYRDGTAETAAAVEASAAPLDESTRRALEALGY
jgi:arylsulfatase A-like enzyme